ncbi:MAG: hypothetical protein M8349_04945 [ANME-2 cluster archaeon]|nr:hypothetical protein [ANME-2 cluster archaeon]MDF1558021.1 hypothetical protein [ANME-2 cluster archaeon]
MRITIEFDFIQKDLLGEQQETDVENGTTLLHLLKSVDRSIEDACSSVGENPRPFKLLNEKGELNGCIVVINGETPSGLLNYGLRDGDTISLLYGYCGG